jgi:hypothetical protein
MEKSNSFIPPRMDHNYGVLISIDKETDNISTFIPKSFIQAVKRLAESVSLTKENATILCSHGLDTDTLFRFYQRKLFFEEVFERCYGRWSDAVLEKNIHIFDSMLISIHADTARVFNDRDFNKTYTEYLNSVNAFAKEWKSILSMTREILSIHFNAHGYPLLSVYSGKSLKQLDFSIPDVFIENFIILYSTIVIPNNYTDQIRSERCVYFRYFDTTIHVVFPIYSSNLDCYYEITMIFEQPCKTK